MDTKKKKSFITLALILCLTCSCLIGNSILVTVNAADVSTKDAQPATKQTENSQKAKYLSGVNLKNFIGDFFKAKKDGFIDTTRFVVYLEKGCEIPMNFVTTIDTLMSRIEDITSESFYPADYHDMVPSYLCSLITSDSYAAKKVKEILAAEDKILIWLTAKPDFYSASYAGNGCVINTSDYKLGSDSIPSELLNHFLFTLVYRNGVGTRSCLANGYSFYYKDQLLSKYEDFDTSMDGYATMDSIALRIKADTMETLLGHSDMGDEYTKIGYRLITYLLETYGANAFMQIQQCINEKPGNLTTIPEEITILKQNFGEDVLVQFCEWYQTKREQFMDTDLSACGDWFIEPNGILRNYFGTDATVVVPDTVVTIQPFTFSDNKTLKTIKIPGSVTSIGGYVFYHCTNLTKIKLPSKMTKLYVETFSGCTNLSNVILPANLQTILTYAFANCTSLTDLEIPESVTLIEPDAFYGCTNLTLHGVKGSYAETYANEYGIPFKETK